MFYEGEEVEAERNGLTLIAGVREEVLRGDFAVVMEPSNAVIEAGCQGSDHGRRCRRRGRGRTRHGRGTASTRSTRRATMLDRLAAYEPRRPVIDGLRYHEGLNAVGIVGGVAGNVIPDRCTVTVNHRFAPDRTVERGGGAPARGVRGFRGRASSTPRRAPRRGSTCRRRRRSSRPSAATANPKFGWTDVARFSAMGIPAVNFGPGNPEFAHTQDEFVPLAHLRTCLDQMTAWLS